MQNSSVLMQASQHTPDPAAGETLGADGASASAELQVPSQDFLLAAAAEAKVPAQERSTAPTKRSRQTPKAPPAPRARPPVRRKSIVRLAKDNWMLVAVAVAAILALIAVGLATFRSDARVELNQ